MQYEFTFPLGKQMRRVGAATIALALGFAATTSAKADMPEFWEKETFKTERITTTSFFEQQARKQGWGDTGDERRKSRQASGASRLGGPSEDDDEADNTPRQRSRPSTRAIDEDVVPKKKKSEGVRVASLGNSYVPTPKPEKNISGGGGIKWLASSGCLDGGLRSILAQVASRFGSVTVNSTCRSREHNRRVGGASQSKHLSGDAADFRVHGNISAVAAFLRSQGGGYKHYGGGLFHIDNGPNRTW